MPDLPCVLMLFLPIMETVGQTYASRKNVDTNCFLGGFTILKKLNVIFEIIEAAIRDTIVKWVQINRNNKN